MRKFRSRIYFSDCMARKILASAPGKILLLGGYSVLDKPNVGYCVGVNQRVHAEAMEVESQEKNIHVEFSLPEFSVEAVGIFDGNKISYQVDSLSFVTQATENALRYLSEHGYSLKSFRLATRNDKGFTYRWSQSKSGLGSSSAVTVATTGAVLELHEFDSKTPEGRGTIHKLSQLSHAMVQKKVGSGFDVATCLYGEHVYERYSPKMIPDLSAKPASIKEIIDKEWDYRIEALPIPAQLKFAVGYTGRAAKTTDFVKRLRAWQSKEPLAYESLMREIDNVNRKAIHHLRELQNNSDSIGTFFEHFNRSRHLTRELGDKSGAPIEPEDLKKIIDATLEVGALGAKLPGAGGGDSIVALFLDEAVREKIYSLWRSLGVEPFEGLSVGNTGGLKVEIVEA